MEKAKFSRKDSKGKEYIDCSECERGGNGNDPNKCPIGGNLKISIEKFNKTCEAFMFDAIDKKNIIKRVLKKALKVLCFF